MAKGKDNASVVGKAVLVSSALAIFLCLIAIIVGAAMLVYAPDKTTWDNCKKQANMTSCGVDPSSGSVSGGRRLMETGLSALESKDTNELKMWAQETFATQKTQRRLSTAYSMCGYDDEKVCSLSAGMVSCKAGTTCTARSGSELRCGSAISNADNCFGDVVQKDTGRSFMDSGCCDKACGGGSLKKAECSASNGVFTETCTCAFSSWDTDYGKCNSFDVDKTTTVNNNAFVKIGSTTCKHSSSSPSNSGTGALCSPKTCKEWAECNMQLAFCTPDTVIANTNAGYEMLRMVIIIGSLVIIVGMLPVCIGGTGKALGNDDIGNICGGIGCCSAVFFTGCGGTIMIFIPFFLGALINQACTAIEDINRDIYSTCADEGLDACGEAMANDVASLCAVGSGMLATSSIQIAAQIFGVLAVILTMVGWCQHRKQPQQQQQAGQVVTVQATAVKA